MGLEGLRWRSSGWDSALPLQGAWLDPLSGTKILHAPQQGQKKRKWVLNPVPKQMLSHVIDLSPFTCKSRTAHLSFPFPAPKGTFFLFSTLTSQSGIQFTGECIGRSSWKQLGNVCKNTDSSYPVIQSLRNCSVGISIQRELFLMELFF